MKNKLVYFSRGGNTKKLADAIAEEIGTICESAETSPNMSETKTLFLGASIYAGNIDAKLKKFVSTLDSSQISQVALFGSSAGKSSASKELRALLSDKGILVNDREFFCKGSFLFANIGRPNHEDLKQAKEFAAKVLSNQN